MNNQTEAGFSEKTTGMKIFFNAYNICAYSDFPEKKCKIVLRILGLVVEGARSRLVARCMTDSEIMAGALPVVRESFTRGECSGPHSGSPIVGKEVASSLVTANQP